MPVFRILLALFLLVVSGTCANAQIKSVSYDIFKNEINGNNPLPAEEVFFVRGPLPKEILMVTMKVGRSGNRLRYSEEFAWRKAFDFNVPQFEVFVSQPIRSNTEYNIVFSFFKKAEKSQIEAVKNSIGGSLDSYIRSNFQVSGSGIKSFNSDLVMISQMNQIVKDALEDYRHILGREFEGFSDVIRLKLEQKDRLNLKKARFNITGRNKEDNVKAVYAAQYVDELILAVKNEANQYLDNGLLTLVESRYLANFPTEKKPGTLPLNFGYATIPIKRTLENREYLHGPYAGISIPLGNSKFTKVLGNASFSTGVFLQNFEASTGEKIEGTFMRLPFYAGFGYKMFRVFRLNVGATTLQIEELGGDVSPMLLQPFVGVSLEFKIWMGFSDKR